MEAKTTVMSSNQSLLDIAVQEAGTIEALFALARQNNVSITDPLQAGQVLVIESLPENSEVLEYYKKEEISPSTAKHQETFEGIGYWGIEANFIIK